MADFTCHDFIEFAGAWIEGERLPAADAHLRDCPRCRAVLADLDAIRSAALAMDAEEIAPPARVWQKIHAQLDAQGLIRKQPRWKERLTAIFGLLPQPIAASAFAAVLLAGALLLNYQNSYRNNQAQWLARTQTATQTVTTQLASATQSLPAPSPMDSNPAVTASLRQNLVIVDNLIAVCEKNVRETPQDEMTRDYLYGAYQQKADLLAAMNERGISAQ